MEALKGNGEALKGARIAKGRKRGVSVQRDSPKRWRGTLKGYGTAINNNRSTLTGDGEALIGDG